MTINWLQHNFIGPVNWVDVLIGTCILAIIPFVLAAYGGHLAAEPIADPGLKWRTKAKFWVLCFIGVVLAFYQQYRASQSDIQRDKREEGAQQMIIAELRNLHQLEPPPSAPKAIAVKPTETERRRSILSLLRNRYILSQKSTDPDILSGKKDPPTEWLNSQLKSLGETWAIPNPPNDDKLARLRFVFGSTFEDTAKIKLPIADGKVRLPFSVVLAGNIVAVEGTLWAKICEGCQYVSIPPGWSVPDASDQKTINGIRFNHVYVGVRLPVMFLDVVPPIDSANFDVAFAYTCENCPGVDMKNAQILNVTPVRP